MNILILTVGSRGDVQPFVALGLGLKAAGYSVRFATSPLFEDFVRSYGFDFAPVDDAVNQLDSADARAAMEGKGRGLALIREVIPMVRRMLDDEWAAAQGTDAIIYHPKSVGGIHIAEKLNISVIMSIPLPLFTPTREFAVPIVPTSRLGGWINRQSYKVTGLITLPYAGAINDWRRQIGLPPRSRFIGVANHSDGKPAPVLYSVSEHVIPRPADWPEDAHLTGYWMLEPNAQWQPSKELTQFLEAGPAPVYIGFGSMAGKDPEKKARIVIEALAKTNQRGIIAAGWGGLQASDLPGSILMIHEAPHHWLFPRVASVVHHGGAGTTAAGLYAGKPSIICPFIADQPFWGRRVHELGVGPAPIVQSKLTSDNLAAAIQTTVSDESMRQKAAVLGEKLRVEDGVGNAVRLVGQYFGPPA
jgi:sterol 3beta-glucosyltransferase